MVVASLVGDAVKGSTRVEFGHVGRISRVRDMRTVGDSVAILFGAHHSSQEISGITHYRVNLTRRER